MKKFFFAFTFILFAASLIYFLRGNPSPSNGRHAPWVTFKKTTPKKIDSYPSTPQEKAEAKIDSDDSQNEQPQAQDQRSPASVKKQAPTSLKDRKWILHANQKLPNKITFKNEPKKNWKELMGQDVMRFLRPETKLLVKKEKSLTLLERDGGLHVEQVYIKMISPEGKHFSYHAFVDSETGKIIKTWNRTIHEPMGKETPKIRPSGFINPNGSTQF